VNRIGIDAGGSLIKMVFEEKGELHNRKFPITEIDSLIQWLNITVPTAKLIVTGGKSYVVKEKTTHPVSIVNEFDAMAEGACFLLEQEFHLLHEEFILISIGTGTSIYHVTPSGYERVIGTGIGGGTFIGLGTLLAGTSNFTELVERAASGDRKKIDLLVRDIYGPNETPIIGDLTAANFGKAHLSHDAKKDDYLISTIQLIAETIILLANQVAQIKNVNKLVFVGSTLSGNQMLRKILDEFSQSLGREALFPTNGAFAGAIGAYLLSN
jgi:type II pantothenate kinase